MQSLVVQDAMGKRLLHELTIANRSLQWELLEGIRGLRSQTGPDTVPHQRAWSAQELSRCIEQYRFIYGEDPPEEPVATHTT